MSSRVSNERLEQFYSAFESGGMNDRGYYEAHFPCQLGGDVMGIKQAMLVLSSAGIDLNACEKGASYRTPDGDAENHTIFLSSTDLQQLATAIAYWKEQGMGSLERLAAQRAGGVAK